MIRRDGHVHTPYCPHGSDADWASYVEKAAAFGLKEITFAEHAPLPAGFSDPAPTKDSAMDAHHLENYFNEIKALKKEYKQLITIYTGLEIDYITGFETETKQLLNEIGGLLDDAVLSVHFMPTATSYICIDYDSREFERFVTEAGGIDEAARQYYETVQASITADLGAYQPKRIGHPALITKFQNLIPASQEIETFYLSRVFQTMAKNRAVLDYNGAGVKKADCGQPYPKAPWAAYAENLGIPIVYGSDAHHPDGLMQGFNELENVQLI
ncbi:histidinol-phosphate phosphatase [Salsuginibacillus halophilus]|uniref:Histidinol-phosphatase n=1 Tax=Salsuginibacillus halophilus TaxID=517424 RepID=A0A2P8HBN8_9BACI|nr:histidinol-phosphatase HisJ [Salsuginibacillus halophilus]PSL43622.1 histidinol-phosphate phosphatase [Salsuginibacillus halophilus]